jgi:hypothetical protein
VDIGKQIARWITSLFFFKVMVVSLDMGRVGQVTECIRVSFEKRRYHEVALV